MITDTPHQTLHFAALNGIPSYCHVRVQPLASGQVLVIASDPGPGCGMSITNAAETVATDACIHFDIDPANLFYIEHYPVRGAAHAPHRETYDRVTFELDRSLGRFVCPQWRAMTDADWRGVGLEPPG